MEGKTKYFQNILSSIFGKKEFDVTTNSHGEKRAFVETGKMESVYLAMNIYPASMKAIFSPDIEKNGGFRNL